METNLVEARRDNRTVTRVRNLLKKDLHRHEGGSAAEKVSKGYEAEGSG